MQIVLSALRTQLLINKENVEIAINTHNIQKHNGDY